MIKYILSNAEDFINLRTTCCGISFYRTRSLENVILYDSLERAESDRRLIMGKYKIPLGIKKLIIEDL